MLRYCPKPKLACIYLNLLLLYLSCSSTLPLPFMGSLGRAVPRQAHTGTDQHYTQHHKPWGSKKRGKNLSIGTVTAGREQLLNKDNDRAAMARS